MDTQCYQIIVLLKILVFLDEEEALILVTSYLHIGQ